MSFFKSPEYNVNHEMQGGAFTIKRPEADYSLVYGFHNREQKVTQAITQADYVFLEYSADWIQNPNFFKDIGQYKSIVKYATQNQIPLGAIDVDITELSVNADFIINAIEPTLGIHLLKALHKKRGQALTRRDFLKSGAQGLFVTWLMHPTINSINMVTGNILGAAPGSNRNLKKLNDRLHPELDIFIRYFRDLVMTYKLQRLAQSMKTKPNICTIVGGAHVGQETLLQVEPEQKLNSLRKFKKILPLIVNTQATFHSILLTEEKSEPQILEIPELKNLWR